MTNVNRHRTPRPTPAPNPYTQGYGADPDPTPSETNRKSPRPGKDGKKCDIVKGCTGWVTFGPTGIAHCSEHSVR